MPHAPLAISLNSATIALLCPLVLLAALYALRVRALTGGSRGVPGWRQACFYASLAVIALTLVLIGTIARQLLWAHMLEELVLGDLAAPLLVLGLTRALLEPLARVPALRTLRRLLCNPLTALALWGVDLYAWQLRVLYDAALQHPGVHALEHVLTFTLGANMWMCLFGALAQPAWFGERARLAYAVVGRLAAATLANLFLWSGNVFYPYYSTAEASVSLSPLADQNIAGAIMLFEQAVLTLVLFAWLFRRASAGGAQRGLIAPALSVEQPSPLGEPRRRARL